jgi:Tfp pilus assembly protein PilF
MTAITEIQPENSEAHVQLAREYLDTVNAYRSTAAAKKFATKACELTKWGNPDSLEVLARAYAMGGDFVKASTYQQRAIDHSEKSRQGYGKMHIQLLMYQRGKL